MRSTLLRPRRRASRSRSRSSRARRAPRPSAVRAWAAPASWPDRSPSICSGTPTVSTPSTSPIIPTALTCSSCATCARSCTGATGIPSRMRSQSAEARSASRSRMGGRSSSRCATPVRVGREARVVGEAGQPDALAELGEQPVVRRSDHQLAVCRPEHLVGSDQREGRAEAARRVAGPQRRGQLVADQRQGRVEQGHVHLAAAAGRRALVQSRDDAERGPDAGADVDHRRADPHAGPVGLAGDADQPCERLHQRVVAGLVARAGPVARTRRSSSRRAARSGPAGPSVAEAPALRRARRAATGRTRPRRRRGGAAPPGPARPSGPARASASSGSRRRTSRCRRRRRAAPQARASSPRAGCSTLITSAPSAARISVHVGPASDEVRSTTRIPRRGSKLIAREHR